MCLVVFIVLLAGTSLLNIMFILNTTSRATNVKKEPMEYDMRFHRLSSNSISPSVYWPKERAPVSKAGKI